MRRDANDARGQGDGKERRKGDTLSMTERVEHEHYAADEPTVILVLGSRQAALAAVICHNQHHSCRKKKKEK